MRSLDMPGVIASEIITAGLGAVMPTQCCYLLLYPALAALFKVLFITVTRAYGDVYGCSVAVPLSTGLCLKSYSISSFFLHRIFFITYILRALSCHFLLAHLLQTS